MIPGRNPKDPTTLQQEIERILVIMATKKPESEEYARMQIQLTALHERVMAERPAPLDKAVVATIVANLAGIMLIVGHERAHVITSKAIGIVRQLR